MQSVSVEGAIRGDDAAAAATRMEGAAGGDAGDALHGGAAGLPNHNPAQTAGGGESGGDDPGWRELLGMLQPDGSSALAPVGGGDMHAGAQRSASQQPPAGADDAGEAPAPRLYKGVYRTSGGRWFANIGARPQQHLGMFDCPCEAARAFDAAARARGILAVNFPRPGTNEVQGFRQEPREPRPALEAGALAAARREHAGRYRGVTLRGYRFQAAVRDPPLYLGLHDTAEAAARAVDAVLRVRRDTHLLNFPATDAERAAVERGEPETESESESEEAEPARKREREVSAEAPSAALNFIIPKKPRTGPSAAALALHEATVAPASAPVLTHSAAAPPAAAELLPFARDNSEGDDAAAASASAARGDGIDTAAVVTRPAAPASAQAPACAAPPNGAAEAVVEPPAGDIGAAVEPSPTPASERAAAASAPAAAPALAATTDEGSDAVAAFLCGIRPPLSQLDAALAALPGSSLSMAHLACAAAPHLPPAHRSLLLEQVAEALRLTAPFDRLALAHALMARAWRGGADQA
jgi:hypothetical protein